MNVKGIFKSYPVVDKDHFKNEVIAVNYSRSLFFSILMAVIFAFLFLISVLEKDIIEVQYIHGIFLGISLIFHFVIRFYKIENGKPGKLHKFIMLFQVHYIVIWSAILLSYMPERYEIYVTFAIVLLVASSILYLKWFTQISIYLTSIVTLVVFTTINNVILFTDPIFPKISSLTILIFFGWGISRILYLKYLENFELNRQLIKNNSENLNLILNTTEEAIYGVDINGNCTFVNQSFLKLLDYSNENHFLNKNMHDLIHHHHEDMSVFPREECDVSRKTLLGIKGVKGKTILWKKNGTYINVEFSSNPRIENGKITGAIISFSDISELLKTKTKVENEKNLAEKYFNIAGVIMLVIDAKGIVTLMNKKGCQILGTSCENIIGKNWYDNFIPDRLIDEMKIKHTQVFSGEVSFSENNEKSVLTTKNKERLISWSNSLIYDNDGNVLSILSSGSDITDLREYENNLIEIGNRDYLTKLYNRRFFVTEYQKLDIPANYPLGLMMMDVNGLKILNDAFGHNIGDIALKKVSLVLTKCLRKVDIISRIGGDEFAVILPKISSIEIQHIKESIKKELTKEKVQNIELSLSIGYELKTDGLKGNMDDILKLAENQMYGNKLSEGSSIRNKAIKAILKTLTDKYSEERTHSEKVSFFCKRIGEELGLNPDNIKELELAGMYHDIGKISIPDAILYKPGRLTKEEFEIIKTHPEISYQILRAADGYSNLAIHALYHHERWDGKGYPSGKAGNDIPLFSRIIGVVDAYEAMTAKRPYKDKISKIEAVKEIFRCSGTQFDPTIAKIFVENVLKGKWEL